MSLIFCLQNYPQQKWRWLEQVHRNSFFCLSPDLSCSWGRHSCVGEDISVDSIVFLNILPDLSESWEESASCPPCSSSHLLSPPPGQVGSCCRGDYKRPAPFSCWLWPMPHSNVVSGFEKKGKTQPQKPNWFSHSAISLPLTVEEGAGFCFTSLGRWQHYPTVTQTKLVAIVPQPIFWGQTIGTYSCWSWSLSY